MNKDRRVWIEGLYKILLNSQGINRITGKENYGKLQNFRAKYREFGIRIWR